MSRAVPVCPHCAQAAEQPLVCDRCAWRWYANPKPAAAELLEPTAGGDEPSVLLLLRAVDPGRGEWDLPAGYLDPQESFESPARREAREEAGLDVELLALAGVYHSPAANAVSVVYRARPTDGSAEVVLDFESSSHVGPSLRRAGLAAAHGVSLDGRSGAGLGRRTNRGTRGCRIVQPVTDGGCATLPSPAATGDRCPTPS